MFVTVATLLGWGEVKEEKSTDGMGGEDVTDKGGGLDYGNDWQQQIKEGAWIMEMIGSSRYLM